MLDWQPHASCTAGIKLLTSLPAYVDLNGRSVWEHESLDALQQKTR